MDADNLIELLELSYPIYSTAPILSAPSVQEQSHGFRVVRVDTHAGSREHVTVQSKIRKDCANDCINAVEPIATETVEVCRYMPRLMTTGPTGSENEEPAVKSPFRMIDTFTMILIS